MAPSAPERAVDLMPSTEPATALSVDAAAHYLGVSRTTLYRLMREGSLPYATIRSHRRILRFDLDTFLEARRVAAA